LIRREITFGENGRIGRRHK